MIIKKFVLLISTVILLAASISCTQYDSIVGMWADTDSVVICDKDGSVLVGEVEGYRSEDFLKIVYPEQFGIESLEGSRPIVLEPSLYASWVKSSLGNVNIDDEAYQIYELEIASEILGYALVSQENMRLVECDKINEVLGTHRFTGSAAWFKKLTSDQKSLLEVSA